VSINEYRKKCKLIHNYNMKKTCAHAGCTVSSTACLRCNHNFGQYDVHSIWCDFNVNQENWQNYNDGASECTEHEQLTPMERFEDSILYGVNSE